MSKLKSVTKNLYEFTVGTISGGASWLSYSLIITAGPVISYATSKALCQKGYFWSVNPFVAGIGVYAYAANNVKIENYARQSSKNIERVVEKGLLVDYFISPNYDAYGAFDVLNDVGKETASILHGKYQTAIATVSKIVYAGAYVGAWIAFAVPGAVAFNMATNIVNKFVDKHKHTSIFEIEALKSTGALVVTLAIGVVTNPEIHALAKSYAKYCELAAEELAGVSGDPVGLLDGIIDL